MPDCRKCGAYLELISCWQCMGEGGFHDCGEDCCCCLDPELNETCDVCEGDGEYPENCGHCAKANEAP